ncbi:lamin tail domain-containing protein 2 isoform X5 [Otolemur garnettii]|uniref:lamin tail domain-containing protein 2 isoform X5 n=1 Tax=Otolemur garnettii TaxID=30611 RepID=UPI0006445462|nr:lamin tail domain-containing protein 2 isoform X5 [Otolemur garnettii]
MASESGNEGQGAEEEALSSLADRHLVSGDLEPPAGTPADPAVPMHLQDTDPHPTRVVHSVKMQVVPESLDPCTLRLLWEQRELEIQALRWAIQNGQSAQHCRILQEVVGLPTERSSCSQEKFLQNQIQKLSLELKEQKEQAQREKEDLEEQLLQARHTMQQLEAELETFKKSCLLKLAQSSWVGRMLRSQTGSVEVVTAETLMDPSDLSDDQSPAVGEGFRLEDVDWNSIAQRYPNLFTNMESSSGHKQPQTPSSLDQLSLESPDRHVEGCHKSVEWSSLPWMGTSSSGGANSDSSSSLLGMPFRVQKVIGHPPTARSFSRDSSLGLEGAASLVWPHRGHMPHMEVPLPERAPLPRFPGKPLRSAQQDSPGAPAPQRPQRPSAPAERPSASQPALLQPEDCGCEPPREVCSHSQPVAGGDSRPGRPRAEAAGVRLPGVHVPLPVGHTAGAAAPCHGMGRGFQQRQEAAALVLRLRACPLPLQQGMCDAPSEPHGRSQCGSPLGEGWVGLRG